MLLYRLTGSSVLFIKHVDCLFPKVELLPLGSPLPPPSPFREPLPDHWNTDLDDFQKLLALKCIRADKLTNAMQVYVWDGVLAQRNNHLPQMGAVLHCHHMLTRSHAHAYIHMLTRSHSHAHMLTFTCSHAHIHILTCSHSLHAHMLTCSHSHTSHARIHTLTCSHSHAHVFTFSCLH